MGIRNKPSLSQKRYLSYGLKSATGKLSMFDRNGKQYSDKTIITCLDHGWCRKKYDHPIGTNWVVCELTNSGRDVLNKD